MNNMEDELIPLADEIANCYWCGEKMRLQEYVYVHVGSGKSYCPKANSQEGKEPNTESLTPAEREELDRLYRESLRRRIEDGGEWPEFRGPGK